VERQIRAFVNCAVKAREAGYDGVEVMGSEGYFINQFLSQATNLRTDAWGGDYSHRMRLPVEILARMREAVGPDFIIIYRLSMIDLVPGGSAWDEIVTLGKAVATGGANIVNTGIGWHEARVPTIATSVPRAAFAWVTQKMKAEFAAAGITTPLVTSNRINTPEVAEQVLADGCADMVSMARPLLADAAFVKKAAQGRADRINTCIACNQACLDHVFQNKTSSCLVNPRACHETELVYRPVTAPSSRKRIAVVGAGPAGLTAATVAAERGHEVHLFDAAAAIGGQLNMAKVVPGKEEFHEMLRYLATRVQDTGVHLHLNQRVQAADLMDYDEVVIATGVEPRDPKIPGQDHPKVLSYIDVLRHGKPVGQRVAVIGAGGIGFDVAEFLVHGNHPSTTLDLPAWKAEWGITDPAEARGGLATAGPHVTPPARHVTLLQRKKGKLGAGLGKTTGWIHRTTLKMKAVEMVGGVNYERIADEGLLVSYGDKRENPTWIACDTVVLCAGQVPLRALAQALEARASSPPDWGRAGGGRARCQARHRPGGAAGGTAVKPRRLIRARASGRRNRRGVGLPGCASGVTVPTSTKPKPIAPRPSMQRAFLSRPAARPTRLGNFNPASTTGSSTRRLQYAQASGVPWTRARVCSVSSWAVSGSSPNRKGRARA
jgi:2,4-dienoyl-CoA reductase (NADPH2)